MNGYTVAVREHDTGTYHWSVRTYERAVATGTAATPEGAFAEALAWARSGQPPDSPTGDPMGDRLLRGLRG